MVQLETFKTTRRGEIKIDERNVLVTRSPVKLKLNLGKPCCVVSALSLSGSSAMPQALHFALLLSKWTF